MINQQKNKRVIENYQEQEEMMILIYAQWCINNDFDPVKLYERAYPNQMVNDALTDALTLTVSKQEADEIPYETMIQALQLFGNDDLAFIIQEAMDSKKKEKS